MFFEVGFSKHSFLDIQLIRVVQAKTVGIAFVINDLQLWDCARGFQAESRVGLSVIFQQI